MPTEDAKNSFEYLDSPEGVQKFIQRLNDSRAIGLDTEGASFHRYVDRVYLIQVAGPEADDRAVIDPLAMETPPGLGELLENPSVQIVLHDADYDLRLLHQDYGWNVRGIFDTRVAAQLLGIKAFGLGALIERYFGVKLDKKFQRADWSMRPLSAPMLEYATADVSYLLALRDELVSELKKLGRSEWAKEEFARLEGGRSSGEPAEDAFLRIKGARDLTRPQLAVLRELVAWRDVVARQMDRAVFRVIGNEPLLEISRLAPVKLADLPSIKGVPRGVVAQRGDEIMAAIDRGLASPPDQHPRFPKAKRYERDAGFDERVARLRVVRDDAARRLDLDPGVLFPRERLEAVARIMPASPEELGKIEDVRRWQVEELGEGLISASGRA